MLNDKDIALQKYIAKVAEVLAQENYSSNILTGTIENISVNGKYKVKIIYQNRETSIEAELINGVQTFKKGDYVYLLKAPISIGETFTTKYYIFGLFSFADDKNLIDLSEWDIVKYATEKTVLTFNEEKDIEKNVAEITNTSIIDAINLRKKGALIVNAKITQAAINNKNFSIIFSLRRNDEEIQKIQWKSDTFFLNMEEQVHLLNFHLPEDKTINKIVVYYSKEESQKVEDLSLRIGYYDYSKVNFNISIDSDKNYFIQNKDNDIINLSAIVTSDNQILDEQNFFYYWVIKDNSITENNLSSFPFAEKGWRLLNDIELVTYYKDSEESSGEKIHAKEVKDIIIQKNKLINSQYKNIVKCFVKYGIFSIESPEIIIYDLDKEDFDYIKPSSINQYGESTFVLTNEDDYLDLSVDAKIENLTGNNKIEYLWFHKNDQDNILSNSKDYKFQRLANEEQQQTFLIICKVIIKTAAGVELGSQEVEFSIIQLESRDSLIEKWAINYLISEKANLTFKKENASDENPWVVLKSDDYWTSFDGESNLKDFVETDSIFQNSEANKEYYLYATWKLEEGLSEEKLNTVTNWEYPEIIRKVRKNSFGEIIDTLSPIELNQLTTFNKLTNGGIEQGLYYDQGDHGNLYINADYIRSGTLRVSNPDGTDEKFYASINNPEVRIGGFQVGNEKIYSDSNGYVELGTKGIQLGRPENEDDRAPFEVDEYGSLHAEEGEIGGYKIEKYQLVSSNGSIGMDSREEISPGVPANSFWAGRHEVYDEEGNLEGTDYTYLVQSDGHLYAKEADIEGKITANSGQFGPLEIKSDGSIETENFYISPLGVIEAQGGRFYGVVRSEDYINGLKLINWGDPTQVLLADGSFCSQGSGDDQQIYYIDSRLVLEYSAPRLENEEMVVDVIGYNPNVETRGDLKQIIIPDESREGYKIVGIKSNSFSNCEQLENIICRSRNLQFIEAGAFNGCDNIKNIYFEHSSSVYFETGWIPENLEYTEWFYSFSPPPKNINLTVTNFTLLTSFTGSLGSLDGDGHLYKGDKVVNTQIYNLNLTDITSIEIAIGNNIIAASKDEEFGNGLNNYNFSLTSNISYTSRKSGSSTWWTGELQSITYEASEKSLIFSWEFTPYSNSANTKVLGGFCKDIFSNEWISDMSIKVEGSSNLNKYYYSSETPDEEIKNNRWHWDRDCSQQGWQIGNNNEMPYNIQNASVDNTDVPETIIDTMYFKVDQYGKVTAHSINAQNGTIGPVYIEDSASLSTLSTDRIKLGGFTFQNTKITNDGSYLDFSQPGDGFTETQTNTYYLKLTIKTASNRKNDKFIVTAYSDASYSTPIKVTRGISGTVSITAENIFNPGPFKYSFTIGEGQSSYEKPVKWNLGISTDTYSYYFIEVDGQNIASRKATSHKISPQIGNSIIVGGTLIPPKDDTTCLIGRVDRQWDNGYFNNINGQTTTPSDKNIKYDINYITNEYDQLYDQLRPVSFKYIDGTSNRTHTGLIAQDLKKSLDQCGIDTKDFAAYCSLKKEDGTEICGIRYGEFVALNIHEIQKAKKQIQFLESKIEELEARLAALEK